MDHVIIGVDTHKDNHIAVAIDAQGARLGSTTISTTRKGYQDLEVWAAQFGQVKAALYRVAIVRMRDDERTKAYAMRKTAEGKTRREIVRCIKRYIVREIYRALCASPALVPAA